MDNQLYRDIYNLHAERLAALGNGEAGFWEHTTDKVCELSEKHDNDPFCNNLLVAVWFDLEEHDKSTAPGARLRTHLGLMHMVIDWAMAAEKETI